MDRCMEWIGDDEGVVARLIAWVMSFLIDFYCNNVICRGSIINELLTSTKPFSLPQVS